MKKTYPTTGVDACSVAMAGAVGRAWRTARVGGVFSVSLQLTDSILAGMAHITRTGPAFKGT